MNRVLRMTANGMLAASLLFVLVWWWVSVWLFVAGVGVYGMSMVVWGRVGAHEEPAGFCVESGRVSG